jgi:hypothetical protein
MRLIDDSGECNFLDNRKWSSGADGASELMNAVAGAVIS